jgi:hypothetical protein
MCFLVTASNSLTGINVNFPSVIPTCLRKNANLSSEVIIVGGSLNIPDIKLVIIFWQVFSA